LLYLGHQLSAAGCKPAFLLGARSKDDLLQLNEFARYGGVYLTTEDGSAGEKGYVTDHSILRRQTFNQL
jgi:dihydroorotate dehydrogenase electron transfer subunit